MIIITHYCVRRKDNATESKDPPICMRPKKWGIMIIITYYYIRRKNNATESKDPPTCMRTRKWESKLADKVKQIPSKIQTRKPHIKKYRFLHGKSSNMKKKSWELLAQFQTLLYSNKDYKVYKSRATSLDSTSVNNSYSTKRINQENREIVPNK